MQFSLKYQISIKIVTNIKVSNKSPIKDKYNKYSLLIFVPIIC